MISIIETDSGTFNVFVIRDGAITLQGNLTKTELVALISTATQTIKDIS